MRPTSALATLTLLVVASTPPADAVNGPNLFGQGPKLVGGDIAGIEGAAQGTAVALSADGRTAILGGNIDGSFEGAAWVFVKPDTIWKEQQKLVGSGVVDTARMGTSVALSADGNTAIVGGFGDSAQTGAAWVFTRSGSTWTQQGSKLVGNDAAGPAQQGWSVALSADGNTALVGGKGDNNSDGAVWVYTRSNGTWTQQGAKLTGSGASGHAGFGWSVALSADGNTAIIGGPNNSADAGAAWVFTRSGNTWTQQGAKLFGTGGATSPALQGTSVALSSDGNTALVGGFGDDAFIGATWVYTRSGVLWTQQGAKLVGTGGGANPSQGFSVALSGDGNTALVGGFNDDSGTGAAWAFSRTGGVWTQRGQKLRGTAAIGPASQGAAVALSADGGTGLVGGKNDASLTGAAWIFRRLGTSADVNADGAATVADVFYLINYLFAGGPAPH